MSYGLTRATLTSSVIIPPKLNKENVDNNTKRQTLDDETRECSDSNRLLFVHW